MRKFEDWATSIHNITFYFQLPLYIHILILRIFNTGLSMWCQPFPFTIRRIAIYHPEYTRLHLFGQPKITKSNYSDIAKANDYLIDLSSKNSFTYKKIDNVVLTLIDETKWPFIDIMDLRL